MFKQPDLEDRAVEHLSRDELKKLAARSLRRLKIELQERINSVADLKDRKFIKDKSPFIAYSDRNYRKIRAEMQKYGIWRERYGEAYARAKETGKSILIN